MGLAAVKNSVAVMDLERINTELAGKSAEEIVCWALAQPLKPFMTTSFGPNAALMLHLVSSQDPDVPVVWVDSGYNLRDTYVVADRLMRELPLNMHIFTPRITAERWNAVYGGVPQLDDPELHAQFAQQIKLEPFRRALDELKPELWLTGIRKDETDFRKSLDIVSYDEKRGILRVAPIFEWSEEQVKQYVEDHQLPSCKHYFDPTKVLDHRECGLHTGL